MTNTLTDDNGQKYELIPNSGNDWYGLRPIPSAEKKAERKQTYELSLTSVDPGTYAEVISLLEQFQLTDKQAEAVAAAVKALMEYVNLPIKSYQDNGKPEPMPLYDGGYIEAADTARKAIQGGNND
jgi:hypothetical protein